MFTTITKVVALSLDVDGGCSEVGDAGVGSAGSPIALTAVGDKVFYPESWAIHAFRVVDGMPQRTAVHPLDAGLGLPLSLIFTGEHLFGAGTGRMVSMDLSGNQWLAHTTPEVPLKGRVGPAVALDGGVVIGSRDDNELVRVRIGDKLEMTTHAVYSELAPTLGEGGLVYTVGGGVLHVWDRQTIEGDQWSVDGTAWKADVSATDSITLDCARDSAGSAIAGRPGTAYFPSRVLPGPQFYINAIVVDSRGLDVTSPWPKMHHDPRNTGNSKTDLFEFACP